jgi:RND family efflux transporter MFP subunit
MLISGLLKAASALLVLGSATWGARLTVQEGSASVKAPRQVNPPAAGAEEMPVLEVKPGKVKFAVIEQGSLEPSRDQLFRSEVEGRTTIISVRPDGSDVKKGELICELDSAAFKEKLVNQTITAKSAEAAYQKAKLARESAEIALTEYVEGTLQKERLALKATIAAAESAVRKASVRLERTRDLLKRVKQALAMQGETASTADMAAELIIEDRLASAEETLEREKMALQQARATQETLEKYTSNRISAGLKAEVEQQRSDELARLATWRAEKSNETMLRQQIENCTIYAPFRGSIDLAEERDQTGVVSPIEEGSMVRRGERLFSLHDLTSPLRLNTKVHESHLNLITPGQPARITFEAIPKQKVIGVVKTIAPLPDATNFFGPKVYSILVDVDIRSPRLQPGMPAQVEFLVPELENVLSVPYNALLYFGDKYHLAVKKPAGGFDWREVAVGQSDKDIAVIEQGLKSGEVVAVDPLALMSEEEKRQRFGS